MGTPVQSSEFRRLLEEGLYKVWEDRYAELKGDADSLYTTISSDRWAEEFYEVTGVGDLDEFTGKIEYAPIYPGFYTRIEPKEFTEGIQFERKLMDDKKYRVMEARADSLFSAATRTVDKMKVEPFAYATSLAFRFTTSEEGVAWASNSHVNKSGASTTTGFDNLGTSVMSKTSVAATRLAMRKFKNDIGERIDVEDDLALIFPDELEETAYEIVKTPKSLDTAEGNVNFQYGKYALKNLRRLSDTTSTSWGMASLSQLKKDLYWIDRIKPEPKQTWDFDTYVLKLAMYFRAAYGQTGWRGIFWNYV